MTKISCRIIYDCIFVKPYMQDGWSGGFIPGLLEDEKLPSFQLIISLICFFASVSTQSERTVVWMSYRKIPTSPFHQQSSGHYTQELQRGSRGRVGGEGRGGKSRKERLPGSVSPEVSLPLVFIALSLPTFAVHRPLSIHWGPPHFHHMDSLPLNSATGWTSSDVKWFQATCLRTGTFGLVWVFWVLSSAWPPKMDEKAWWVRTNESQCRKNTD